MVQCDKSDSWAIGGSKGKRHNGDKTFVVTSPGKQKAPYGGKPP